MKQSPSLLGLLVLAACGSARAGLVPEAQPRYEALRVEPLQRNDGSFHNTTCALHFRYPRAWRVTAEPLENGPPGCAIWLRLPDPSDGSLPCDPRESEPCTSYIYIMVRRTPLRTTTFEQAGLRQGAGGWWLRGVSTAAQLKGNNWRGLYASLPVLSCGKTRSDEVYVIGNNAAFASVATDDSQRHVVDQILPTLEFLVE